MKIKTILVLAAVAACAVMLEAATVNIVQSYQTAAGSLTGTTAVTDTTEFDADLVWTNAVTNRAVSLPLTLTNLQCLCLYSSAYATAMVNSTSSPANTFILQPGAPQIGTGTNALGLVSNVTTWYLTCTNTNGCTFSLRSILHTTN